MTNYHVHALQRNSANQGRSLAALRSDIVPSDVFSGQVSLRLYRDYLFTYYIFMALKGVGFISIFLFSAPFLF